MAKAVEPNPAPEAPMTFRDYVGEVEASEPVEVAVPHTLEPEPAKPATKKEN